MKKRYSAKLLFQFRVIVDGECGKRRICEERIVLIEAASARTALISAKSKGKKAQFRYRNANGNPVRFEFIGVMDLLCLGVECKEDEVWYDIVERLLPLERKSTLIPPESELNAIRHEL
jgi:Domain of unknown function (DUF4288)